MARTLLEIEKLVLENRNAVNDVLANAKQTSDLPIATDPVADVPKFVAVVKGVVIDVK